MAKAKKIYLSPAAHIYDNSTRCPGTCSENTHCNAYMDIVERRLRAHGFDVRRGDKALTGSAAMNARVREANTWGADLYYVAHTNAGGGRYSMTMCWSDQKSIAKAKVIHKHRRCITHKVQPRTDLYEIRATKMTCLYDELFFHDSAEDCAWFHSGGMEKLAEETVQALCEICKVVYKPQEQPTEPVKPAEPVTPAAPEKPAAPKAGDKITLSGGRLYTTARGAKYVTRTGTYFLYDGQKVGERYRVTNRTDRVGKKPAAVNVSGWVEL